ncbi:MAG: transglutaminase-like domain-containing protein [bacterium]|nr:transglutaminase-like domain-containing protein [bacterium]
MSRFFRFGVTTLLLFLLASFKFSQPVLAASEFTTTYDVTYEVGNDGVTLVTQKVNLKNLTSQFYASNFTLSIGSTTVSEVSASDGAGSMEASVDQKSNKTSITLKFNQQIAGVGKTQDFTLRFKSTDFAQHLGKTWEVNLPKIPEGANIASYNLLLSVPVEFGDPTSISPNPLSHSQSYDRIFFNFNKNQLEKSGISVNFGTIQVFNFSTKYHLENSSLFPVLTSISLPPDTDYQQVSLTNITPRPLNVTTDEDGNYLAWYRLPRHSSQTVEASGKAKLFIAKRDLKPALFTDSQLASWTKSDVYWEKENPAISSALTDILKGEKVQTNKDKAALIYRYVVNTLKYDTSRLDKGGIERLGAVTALNNPNSAVCMEFTDLFIALSRAAGVPAREMDGFAYSLNKSLRPLSLGKDLLHAWPEYWDEKKGWVMVDPTWENTSGGVDYFNKFDLNHLVLAIKGVSSKTPYVSEEVSVTLAEDEFEGKTQNEMTIDIPDIAWSGFPVIATVKVSNNGNILQPPLALALNSDKMKILGSETVNFGPLPPFGSATSQFNLRAPFSWQSFEATLTINAGDQKIVRKVTIKPFFLLQPFPYLIAGTLALMLGIYLTVLGLHFHRRRAAKKAVST